MDSMRTTQEGGAVLHRDPAENVFDSNGGKATEEGASGREDAAENKDGGQRRSIISSIRLACGVCWLVPLC